MNNRNRILLSIKCYEVKSWVVLHCAGMLKIIRKRRIEKKKERKKNLKQKNAKISINQSMYVVHTYVQVL